jgi:hypothetical protein
MSTDEARLSFQANTLGVCKRTAMPTSRSMTTNTPKEIRTSTGIGRLSWMG